MSRKLLYIFFVAIAIAVICALIWNARKNSPEAKEDFFAVSVSKMDWASIYDLHQRSVWQKHKISKDQFVRFMNAISRDIPPQKFSKYETSEFKPYANAQESGIHSIKIIFPNLKNYSGRNLEFYSQTANTREGWVVPSGDLPIWIAECVTKNRHERHRLLYKAMVEAQIDSYPVTNGGLTMTQSGLEKYLNGEAKDDRVVFEIKR